MGCRSKCCAPATDGWWSLASPRRLMSTVRATAERAVWGADQSAAHPRRTAGGRWPARGASCPRSAPRLMANPTLSWNLVRDVHELLAYQFMVNALQAGTIVAVTAGVVGWYMVLRRQSFAGHTIAVMSFPGAAGAALAGVPSAFGYYLACGIAALAIGRSGGGGRRGRSSESAAIGVVQVSGLALGFLFLSLYPGVLAPV